jgi:hypothetical protein
VLLAVGDLMHACTVSLPVTDSSRLAVTDLRLSAGLSPTVSDGVPAQRSGMAVKKADLGLALIDRSCESVYTKGDKKTHN